LLERVYMKNWSVKSMLLGNSVLSNSLLILVGAVGLTALITLDGVVLETNKTSEAVQRQMDADMMHDAIRGDVLSALLAVQQGKLDEIPDIRAGLSEHAERLLSNLTENAQTSTNPLVIEQSRAALDKAKRYVQDSKKLLQGSIDGGDLTALSNTFLEDFEILETDMAELSTTIAAEAKASKAHSSSVMETSIVLTGGILALALLLTIPLALFTLRSISKPLQNLIEAMQQIERTGDLTLRAGADTQNEIGKASQSFNTLMTSVQYIVKDVRTSSLQLLQNSHALAAASEQALSTSHANSEAASSVATAVEELSASVANIAQQAHEAREASRASLELSQKGRNDIDRAGREMNQISDAVKHSASNITQLETQADSISQITGVIRGIAEQTNLLALNAAIEAARAGEEGRGFAVVADEVRNLAERTAESTTQITEMIEAIQRGTQQAVENMNEGVKRVNFGVSLTTGVIDTISSVEDRANQASLAVSQISDSLHEQEAAGTDISRTVERVAQISEESHSVAQETAARARELSQLAQRLEERISRFTA